MELMARDNGIGFAHITSALFTGGLSVDTTRTEHASSPDYSTSTHSSSSQGEAGRQFSPRPEHAEGQVARTIEEQTAKLPSDTFLWAALGSMAASLVLQLSGQQKTSLFIGQWAPSFLLLGLYNKLVKVASSH